MSEGRPTEPDQHPGEALEVIAYFDTLMRSSAGLDALLRGAAALSGAVAGVDRRHRVTRRRPDGELAPEPAGERSAEKPCAVGSVWIEREGPPHATDAVIVERLALAVDLLEARPSTTSDLEIALDASQPRDVRAKALARLRIDTSARIRITATHQAAQASSALSIPVPTTAGLLYATLWRDDTLPDAARLGIGKWVTADQAPESWHGAVIALRLTAPERPVIDATDIGSLLLVASAYDPMSPHEDVRTLARLDRRSASILLVLVESDSLRSAAATLGMHHSTLQAKHESLTEELGYDPRTITGRIRYATAELLRRLTDPRALG